MENLKENQRNNKLEQSNSEWHKITSKYGRKKKKLNKCRSCGAIIPKGYKFCPSGDGESSCYFYWNNVLSREPQVIQLTIQRGLIEEIKDYASIMGLNAKEATVDLIKYALEIRLPQLGLKSPSKRFQPARYPIKRQNK